MTGKQIYDINNDTLKQGIVVQKYFSPRFRHRVRIVNATCRCCAALFGAQLNQIKIKNNYLSSNIGCEV